VSVSLIHSKIGNDGTLEAIIRMRPGMAWRAESQGGDYLIHYYRDNATGKWRSNSVRADGKTITVK
jgi:hypothetical protein